MDNVPYINREISWLSFNDRVLEEAVSPRNPPLERANFLAITASNLDEFFMVRVGKLEGKIASGSQKTDPAGLTAQKQLNLVWRGVRAMTQKQYEILNNSLLPALRAHGFTLVARQALTKPQEEWLGRYFDTQIKPVLTPRVLNPIYPFPLLAARRLHIAVTVDAPKGGERPLCLVRVPGGLPRVVLLPMGEGKARGILLEDVIRLYIARLFPTAVPENALCFRVTRNTDYLLDIHSADSILDEMTRIIKRRPYGRIVRVETEENYDKALLQRVMKLMRAPEHTHLSVSGPVDLTFLPKTFKALPGFDALRYPAFYPRTEARLKVKESIFRTIRGGDILLHHPYDSYEPVVRFINEAADDDRVLAIKQTLYRVSRSSPFIAALVRAAQKGKQVTVLVEVRARFDEENNIAWCKALEKAGCHVIYGMPKWKTHSKILLVVRKEERGLNQYLHLGTGNYNDMTAKGYTDLSILTCDPNLAQDAGAFFNIVTGYQDTFPLKELIESPFSLRKEFQKRIERERRAAEDGEPAAIIAKMNSLSDPQIIEKLYEAAESGVKIYLMVRGICCLKVPDNGNIVVRSIVGRFLEHARIYVFWNGGEKETFISSADWMPRNLDKRVELTIPVKDERVIRRVHEILAIEFSDDTKAWEMGTDGQYKRVSSLGSSVSSQEEFMDENPFPVDFDSVFDLS